ncbi:hypothetical protein WN71_035135 [Streptomyces mangrovisoli]|uniref:Uncharacterized protein n=1 Tax=Streptomyces mangrovisoli TaxID=1428628 RepID=A0A1J4NM83_9ACTN|nr:hypothetical protein WN71_035135 [Streptomyces mangrovisoli]
MQAQAAEFLLEVDETVAGGDRMELLVQTLQQLPPARPYRVSTRGDLHWMRTGCRTGMRHTAIVALTAQVGTSPRRRRSPRRLCHEAGTT